MILKTIRNSDPKINMKLKISYIKPCVTSKNKIMAKIEVNKNIDIEKAQHRLKKEFNLKYDMEVGAIRFNHKKMAVLIFNSGEIIIRRAESEKLIFDTVKKINSLIFD